MLYRLSTGCQKNYLNLILSKKVDSIILVGSNFIAPTELENAYISEAAEQVPIMLLNAAYDHPNVYGTLCDDYAAMYEAASAMLKAGIRHILYVYNAQSYSGIRKRKGITDAMQRAGIKIPTAISTIIPDGWTGFVTLPILLSRLQTAALLSTV